MDYHIAHSLDDKSTPFYETHLERLDELIDTYKKTPLPHFALPARTDDIAAMQNIADKFSDARYIIILGTGGSSLGAQVLAQISGHDCLGYDLGYESQPALCFADNLDAESMARLLQMPRLKESRFLVVSKSGGTAETLMQFSACLSALTENGLKPQDYVAVLSEDSDNLLRRIAEKYNLAFTAHDKEIGGRFSVLTNTGLLPAIWAGIDPHEIRAGAKAALDNLFSDAPVREKPAASGAALQIAHAQAGRNISVLFSYADRLQKFGLWYRQLWAESLGKNGQGTTPISGLGPVDQHSQLQLYLDGPDDKFYTLISHSTKNTGALAGADFGADADYYTGRKIGDLVDAEMRATRDTLIAHNRPVRHIALPEISPPVIGELLMNFMLETILAAALCGVDAFDQPAVEDGKKRAKQYMGEHG